MDFIAAKNFTRATKPRTITLVVIHTAECGERTGSATSIARYFADQPKHGALDPKWCRRDKDGNLVPWSGASAHCTVDSIDAVQSVRDEDIAWHAGPANGYSIGIEHAGRAGQTPAEWADDYSIATLERSAKLVASLCHRYSIPVVRLAAEDLATGKRSGICGHVDVTRGLKSGAHWDPGPNFPWALYLDMVRVEFGRIVAAETHTLPELPVREDDGGASRHRATMDAIAEMARNRYRGE